MLSVSSGEQAVISYQDHTCYCPIVQSRRYVKERKDRMKRLESAQAPLFPLPPHSNGFCFDFFGDSKSNGLSNENRDLL